MGINSLEEAMKKIENSKTLNVSVNIVDCFGFKAGILLSYFIELQMNKATEGWFSALASDVKKELYMSKDSQSTLKKKFKQLGILEVKKQGLPCVTLYKINFKKLSEILSQKK